MSQATSTEPGSHRTPPKRKARQLAKYLRPERPDYAYLKELSRLERKPSSVSWPSFVTEDEHDLRLVPVLSIERTR